MTTPYRIFGSEMSPYSVKVRAYFRYKKIPHVWIARRADNDDDFRRYARLPLVPTVATPDDRGLQDSTPIMEALEAEFPEPSIHPSDPRLRFLSELLEEFGDEWGNKLMFHHRWFAEVDQLASAQTLARLSLPFGGQDEVAARAGFVRERMVSRTHFVGSSEANAPLISRYYLELIDLLEPCLVGRPYLLGPRPAFADFGIGAQLYECSVDPTCGSMIRGRAPAVLDWCHRMMEPRAEGPFADWGELAPTLEPLLTYVGRTFLPWTTANARALNGGATEFSVELPGGTYVQPPQKYHARSLAALKARYAAARGVPGLEATLAEADCLQYLS
jgi:glutathione S-transferase